MKAPRSRSPCGSGRGAGRWAPPADEGHIHYQPAVHAGPPGSRIHLPREQPQPVGGCSAQPAEGLGVGEGRHLARVQYHRLAVRGAGLHAEEVLVRLGDHRQPQAGAGRGRHQGRHVGQIDPSRTGPPGQSRRADAPASRAGPVLHLEDEAQPPGVRSRRGAVRRLRDRRRMAGGGDRRRPPLPLGRDQDRVGEGSWGDGFRRAGACPGRGRPVGRLAGPPAAGGRAAPAAAGSGPESCPPASREGKKTPGQPGDGLVVSAWERRGFAWPKVRAPGPASQTTLRQLPVDLTLPIP